MRHEPPQFDARGNQLRRYELRDDPLRLLLCADAATFRQVRRFLAAAGIVASPCGFPEEEATVWTFCLSLPAVPDGLVGFLDLLSSVLVLQKLPPAIDAARALDFYKIPREGVDPNDWPDTEIGALVNTMKYWRT